jgi:hypothetical protein
MRTFKNMQNCTCSTYLGSTTNRAPSVRFDSQGGVYVLGESGGTLPVTLGAYYSTPSGVYLAHLSSAGSLKYGNRSGFPGCRYIR